MFFGWGFLRLKVLFELKLLLLLDSMSMCIKISVLKKKKSMKNIHSLTSGPQLTTSRL